MLLGHARVSTLEQDEALQVDALREAGCERVFVDHATGMLDRRPELDRLLEQVRAGATSVVWRLDRLGRSLRHLIELSAELESGGVGLRSLTEHIDSTTPGGKLVFHVFGALAEFEAALIRERTMAGLAAARARGRNGGRPATLTPAKLAKAQRLYDARQLTVEETTAVVGVSRSTLYRHLDTSAAPSR